jgi:C-terminal processing protease CtpA/Prc
MQTRKKKPSKRLKKYFDPERPVFSEYVSQMVKESNEKGINKLILDLRNNNGGSVLICLQLLYHLTSREDLADFDLFIHNGDFYKHYFKNDFQDYVNSYYQKHSKYPTTDTLFHAGKANSNKNLFDKITDPNSPYFVQKDRPIFNGKIVVIADFSTHSAGALFTTLLQDNKVAQVIGTELSNNPTGPTTWTPFKLPNSKIEVSIPSQYLIRPDKTKSDKFTPDIYIEKSLQDIMSGRDPLFEKALEILSKD